jgi:protoheme IX farnesyltransferase
VGTACIAAASALLVAFSLAVYFVSMISVFYLVATAAAGAPIVAYSAKLVVDRKVSTAWTLFKMTSPYLAIIFVVLGVAV